MPREPSEPPRGLEQIEEEAKQKKEEELSEEIEEKRQKKREQENQRLEQYGRNVTYEEVQEELSEELNQLLKPQFGSKMDRYEKQFRSFLSSLVPIANIRRDDIPLFLSYFDENYVWFKVRGINLPPHLYPSLRMVYELNLTRAIQGFERKIQGRMKGMEQSYRIEEEWSKYLQPDFEDTSLKGYSEHYSSALSNVVPLANIQRDDIPSRYLNYFDEIHNWIKVMGIRTDPQSWVSFRHIFHLELTRSVGGMESKMRGQMQEVEGEKREKTILDKLKGLVP